MPTPKGKVYKSLILRRQKEDKKGMDSHFRGNDMEEVGMI